VSAFRRGEDAWDRVELWRLRGIAQLSFTCVFLALAIFPIFALLGEQDRPLNERSERWALYHPDHPGAS